MRHIRTQFILCWAQINNTRIFISTRLDAVDLILARAFDPFRMTSCITITMSHSGVHTRSTHAIHRKLIRFQTAIFYSICASSSHDICELALISATMLTQLYEQAHNTHTQSYSPRHSHRPTNGKSKRSTKFVGFWPVFIYPRRSSSYVCNSKSVALWSTLLLLSLSLLTIRFKRTNKNCDNNLDRIQK